MSPPLIAVTGGTPFVQVVCGADGYPSPTFTWTTPPDVPTSLTSFASNESVSVLKVSPEGGLRLVHSGLYSCGAENAARMAATTFRVIVQGREGHGGVDPLVHGGVDHAVLLPRQPSNLQTIRLCQTGYKLPW